MSKPKECPYCDIISEPDTAQCECGYRFAGELDDWTVARERARMQLMKGVAFLVLVCLGGILAWSLGKLAAGLIVSGGFCGGALVVSGIKGLLRKKPN